MELIVDRYRYIDKDRTPYTFKLFERFGWLKSYYDILYHEPAQMREQYFLEYQRNARADEEKHLGEAALYVVEDYFMRLNHERSSHERKHILSAKIIFDELAQESEGAIQLNWVANMWIELRPQETEYSVDLAKAMAEIAASYACANALATLAKSMNSQKIITPDVIALIPNQYLDTVLSRFDEAHAISRIGKVNLKYLMDRITDFDKLKAEHAGIAHLEMGQSFGDGTGTPPEDPYRTSKESYRYAKGAEALNGDMKDPIVFHYE